MPHQRKRIIIDILKKRLKLWPILGLIGPRQTGKSTLLRELLAPQLNSSYYTMDSKNSKERAQKNPESFAEPEQGKVKIIDEVQKVPDLFDAAKLHVDKKRRPGTYIFSGSTEFSQFTGIRESLTGRIGILNLYPFNRTEIYEKPASRYFLDHGFKKYSSTISLHEFDRNILCGGMPGFFYLRSRDEFSASAQVWIETTCFRDLAKIMKNNFDGDLALSILTALAQSEEPSAASVASVIGKDARIVKRYLDGFTQILVLIKINPHPLGVGKEHYVIVDSGIASHLGSDKPALLRSHILVEALSLFEANGAFKPQLEYYRSEKKSYVPLILSWKSLKKNIAIQICDEESPSRLALGSIESLRNRGFEKNSRFLLLNQSNESYQENKIEHHPIRG